MRGNKAQSERGAARRWALKDFEAHARKSEPRYLGMASPTTQNALHRASRRQRMLNASRAARRNNPVRGAGEPRSGHYVRHDGRKPVRPFNTPKHLR